MANFFISFGLLNKKLLFPLIYILIYFCANIYNLYSEDNEVSLFIDGFGYSFGQILTFFINQFFKYRRNIIKKKKIPSKKYFIDYLFLFLISIFYHILGLTPFYIYKSNENENSKEMIAYKYRDLFINDAIEVILVTIVTYFLLKYKYYIHHIISIIAIIIISLTIDLILGNFTHINSSIVINSILYIIGDSFLYSYCKHLMEKKYYHFMDIIFISGIFDFILFLVTIIIIFSVQYVNGDNTLIFQFYEFYNIYGVWKMILTFLLGIIFYGFIIYLLEMKIVDILGPNFVYISYQIGKMPSILMSIEGYERWIVLALSTLKLFFPYFTQKH